MKKNLIATMVATLLFSFSIPVGAKNIKEEEINKKLIEEGLDSSIVELMPKNDKDKIYKSLVENSDNVQISNSVVTVDNLSVIEYYTNSDDSELSDIGLSKEDIKQVRKSLAELEAITYDELNKKNPIDKFEFQLLKKALKKNPNYKKQNIQKNKEATTSGQISGSKLSFDMVVTDKKESYPLYS